MFEYTAKIDQDYLEDTLSKCFYFICCIDHANDKWEIRSFTYSFQTIKNNLDKEATPDHLSVLKKGTFNECNDFLRAIHNLDEYLDVKD